MILALPDRPLLASPRPRNRVQVISAVFRIGDLAIPTAVGIEKPAIGAGAQQ
jgi:hypothetical protein